MNHHDHTQNRPSHDIPPPLPSHRTPFVREGARSNQLGSTQGKQGNLGADDALPAGISGWCWGAFLLNWVWAIRFRVWWGLLAFVPLLGLAVPIWLGVKGREMAWRRGNWRNVQDFNHEQRKWSIGGAVVIVLVGVAYAGSVGYQQWQAHKVEVAAQESEGLRPEQIVKLSAPVQLNQAVVPTTEPRILAIKGQIEVEEKMPVSIDTLRGLLEERTLPDRGTAIFLGEQQLFHGEFATWHQLARKFQRSDGSEIVLMRSSGGFGNRCEAYYFFLVVTLSEIRYTPEFGTCSAAVRYEQKGDIIYLTIPKWNAEGESNFQFGPDEKILEEAEWIKMNEFNNPSR